MAVYKIYPTKDASIYTEYPAMNTGIDEILECSTYIRDGNVQASRYLIQFSDSEINDIVDNKISGSSFKTYLKNYDALVTGLNSDSTIYFYPTSGSWDMGTGRFENSPETVNGVSWGYQDYSGSTAWPTSSFGDYATASFQSTVPGGGVWYTGSSLGLDVVHTQSFNYSDPTDIKVDVTNTVLTWYSGGFDNNGFLVKQKNSDEFVNDSAKTTTLKFFSIDTHTIYPPQLEFRWDDYTFSTGSSSNTVLSTPQSFMSVYNNEEVYYSESIARFRISAIPKNPTRTFTTSSLYTTNYYLPEDVSLYAVKDTMTNDYIIDFDSSYTKISADETSSYFDIYMSGLEPERYYTILIKTVIDGTTKIFDEDIRFKVSN